MTGDPQHGGRVRLGAAVEGKVGLWTRVRSFAFTIYMVAATIVIGFGFIPCIVSSRGSRWVSRVWCRTLLFGLRAIAGTGSRILGLDGAPKAPFILAAKHLSAWDVIALSCAFKESVMVAKRELFWIPIFGWYLHRTGCIGIQRSTSQQALLQLLKKGKKMAREGRIIVIFPEGSRSMVDGALPEYKRGVALLYRTLGVPVVPCALNSGLFWPKNSSLHFAGTITAELGAPIPPGLSQERFMNALKQDIEERTRLLVDLARNEAGSP